MQAQYKDGTEGLIEAFNEDKLLKHIEDPKVDHVKVFSLDKMAKSKDGLLSVTTYPTQYEALEQRIEALEKRFDQLERDMELKKLQNDIKELGLEEDFNLEG